MIDDLEPIRLPINGRKFETARGTVTASLRGKPDHVIHGDKMSSTICHNIVFATENGETRSMNFWLAPEFVVYDPTMQKTHQAAFQQIQGWIESEDFNSDQQDYWLNENLRL